MGKALIINGADFSANKLGTITLLEDIPCTSIVLDLTELELANIGTTRKINATVTPLNTTDTVTWSSSNGRIATVSQDGTVTVTGAGEVTITATCGSKTASCVVTATHTLNMTKAVGRTITGGASAVGAPNATIMSTADSSGHYGIAYQTTTLEKAIYLPEDGRYPVYFGHANELVITAPNTIRVTAVITDSTKSPEGSDTKRLLCAMWLKKDASQYDKTVALGNRVITDIPDDADSVGFCFQMPDATMTMADLESITVVAR